MPRDEVDWLTVGAVAQKLDEVLAGLDPRHLHTEPADVARARGSVEALVTMAEREQSVRS